MREDLSKFDAGFFGLPKYDVDAMDPQGRIVTSLSLRLPSLILQHPASRTVFELLGSQACRKHGTNWL
jgi:hypothetical protein